MYTVPKVFILLKSSLQIFILFCFVLFCFTFLFNYIYIYMFYSIILCFVLCYYYMLFFVFSIAVHSVPKDEQLNNVFISFRHSKCKHKREKHIKICIVFIFMFYLFYCGILNLHILYFLEISQLKEAEVFHFVLFASFSALKMYFPFL